MTAAAKRYKVNVFLNINAQLHNTNIVNKSMIFHIIRLLDKRIYLQWNLHTEGVRELVSYREASYL